MTNRSSQHGAYFGFYWQTDDAERKEIFRAGWSAGSDDEAYNSSDN